MINLRLPCLHQYLAEEAYCDKRFPSDILGESQEQRLSVRYAHEKQTMPINPDAPLNTYRDAKTPGAIIRTIGGLLLLLSLSVGFYISRMHAIEQWTPVKATITKVYGETAPRYDFGPGYRICVNAQYMVAQEAYEYKGTARDAIPSYDTLGEWELKQLKRKRTLIDLRYDPEHPQKAIAENVVARNRSVLSWSPAILICLGGIGLILLLAGTASTYASIPRARDSDH